MTNNMKKIFGIALADLTNSEHFEFISEVIELIKKFGAAALNIIAEFAVLQDLFAKEDICMKIIPKSEYTEMIKEADKARDLSFYGIVQYVKSYLNYFVLPKARAAERIHIMINSYGDVAKKAYDAESADLDNILQELNGKYKDDVVLLGFSDRVDKLEGDNKLFKTLVENRYEEWNTRPDFTPKEIRPQVNEAYHTITNRITALILVEEKPETYLSFVHELNKHIEHYNVIIKLRKANNKTKQKNLAKANISGIDTQLYTGAHIQPLVKVYYKDKQTNEELLLVEDKDYIIECVNNVEPGTATLTIKGKGAYHGKKITTFNIAREL
jgi:L-lactate utilization protein LutC